MTRKRIPLCSCAKMTGKRLSPSLADAADEVMQLPMKLDVARRMLGGLRYAPPTLANLGDKLLRRSEVYAC